MLLNSQAQCDLEVYNVIVVDISNLTDHAEKGGSVFFFPFPKKRCNYNNCFGREILKLNISTLRINFVGFSIIFDIHMLPVKMIHYFFLSNATLISVGWWVTMEML